MAIDQNFINTESEIRNRVHIKMLSKFCLSARLLQL